MMRINLRLIFRLCDTDCNFPLSNCPEEMRRVQKVAVRGVLVNTGLYLYLYLWLLGGCLSIQG